MEEGGGVEHCFFFFFSFCHVYSLFCVCFLRFFWGEDGLGCWLGRGFGRLFDGGVLSDGGDGVVCVVVVVVVVVVL